MVGLRNCSHFMRECEREEDTPCPRTPYLPTQLQILTDIHEEISISRERFSYCKYPLLAVNYTSKAMGTPILTAGSRNFGTALIFS